MAVAETFLSVYGSQRSLHRRACRVETTHGSLKQSLALLLLKERLHPGSETDVEKYRSALRSRGS